jgi:hypothetical protein
VLAGRMRQSHQFSRSLKGFVAMIFIARIQNGFSGEMSRLFDDCIVYTDKSCYNQLYIIFRLSID